MSLVFTGSSLERDGLGNLTDPVLIGAAFSTSPVPILSDALHFDSKLLDVR